MLRLVERDPWLVAVNVMIVLAAMVITPASAAGYQFLDETSDAEYVVSFTLAASPEWLPGDEARLVFSFTDESNHYLLRLRAGKVMLLKVAHGRQVQLGREVRLPEAPSQVWNLAVSRRAWIINVSCDGRTLLHVYDDTFAQGRVGWEAMGGWRLLDVALQPLGRIWLDDDFMRAEGEATWDAVSGKWELRSARTAGLKPDWSANPFSYCGSARFGGIVTTGYWFWDDYRITAAVKSPASHGAIGLVCRFVDPDNYYLYRWTRAEGLGGQPPVGRQQLIRVLDGTWRVLADQAGSWEPNQWYELGLGACEGRLQATVDGQVVLEVTDDTIAYGKAGLYVGDSDGIYFDDVHIRDFRLLAADFGDDTRALAAPVMGKWELRQGHIYGTCDRARARAAAVIGSPEWSNYTIDVNAKPKDAAAVGVYAAYRSPGDYYLFRWGADEQNPGRFCQEILRVKDGKGRVLGKRRCDYAPTTFSRLTFTVDKGYLSANVNGGQPLEAADPTAVGVKGKVGLYVEGGQRTACFDDLNVSFLGEMPEPERIVEQFVKEDSMSNWARETALWRTIDDNTRLFDTPLFGDFHLEAQLPSLDGIDGSASLLLCNTEDVTDPAAVVKLTSPAGQNALAATVEGQPEGLVPAGPVTASEQSPRLVVDRRGGCLLAWLDGKPLAGAASPNASGARWLALRSDGLNVDIHRVKITSPNLTDCLFSAAPTGWVSARGTWEIRDRWACTPGWAWLGSGEDKSPLLLSKRSYSGDIQLDFWACIGHPYSAVGNINAALCVTAPELCSGYSFIYGGQGNTASLILRGDQVVLSNEKVRFPTDKNAYHRHWFHIRIRKFGNAVSYWVDGELVGIYTDPNPLPEGRVGFWTYGDTRILIARARIAAQRAQTAH